MNIDNLSYFTSRNVKIFDEPMSEAAEAVAKASHTRDLMYLKFELLHANTNRNSDTFEKSELSKSFKTLTNKPINWEHRPTEIIGHIYDSHYVKAKEDAEGNVDINTDVIVCEGVVYKYKVPQRAMEIQARYDASDLYFSMETYFEKAECSKCEKSFEKESDYCSHLKNRHSLASEDSRILRGLLFGGAGCVENPADDAKGLVVASQKTIKIMQLIEAFGSHFTPEEYINFMNKIK